MKAIDDLLADWMVDAERLVIVGIGNPMRRDDGVGVHIAKRLKSTITADNILVLVSESVPESYLQPIIDFKPSHILLIDAASLGQEPGQVHFIPMSETQDIAVSTHSLPLHLVCNYLQRMTGAKTGLLLIQPEAVDFGEGLSPAVERAAMRVIAALKRLVPRGGHSVFPRE